MHIQHASKKQERSYTVKTEYEIKEEIKKEEAKRKKLEDKLLIEDNEIEKVKIRDACLILDVIIGALRWTLK